MARSLAGLKKLHKILTGYQVSFTRDLTPVIAKEFQALVEETFASLRSPEGKKWAALKDKSGRPPLQGVSHSLRFQAHASKIMLASEKGYLIFHQLGTKKMARRNFLPLARLPQRWRNRIAERMKTQFLKNMNEALRSR